MELTSEDKQRIYKEVNRIFNESESVDLVHELMFKVGEYEHNYQREQQANLKQDDTWLKKLEFYTKGFDTKKFQKVEEYVKWVRIRDDLPNEPLSTLEAERSELYKLMVLKEEEQRNELKEWKEAYRSKFEDERIELNRQNDILDAANKELNKVYDGMCFEKSELLEKIKQLEVERSEVVKENERLTKEVANMQRELYHPAEVRNKVIEEIDKYYQENVFTLPTIDAEQCILALKAAYQFILSLKTK